MSKEKEIDVSSDEVVKVQTKCSPYCLYFPQEPNEILEDYIDEKTGVHHRKCIRKCKYDGHIINNYTNCENFFKNNQNIFGNTLDK